VRSLAIVISLAGCFGLDIAKPAPSTIERAVPFSLAAHDGSQVALADVLAKDHAVLVFYRGHW
jgi:hypothetical protein